MLIDNSNEARKSEQNNAINANASADENGVNVRPIFASENGRNIDNSNVIEEE